MPTTDPSADSADDPPVLRLTRTFDAPRERVYAAFTEPGQLAKWWGPEGFTLPVADFDASPGATYRLHMQAPDGGLYRLSGTIREVEPPARLVYTWIWAEGDIGGVESLVTIEFHENGAATDIVLTHALLPTADARDNHAGGWTSSFVCLDAALTEGDSR